MNEKLNVRNALVAYKLEVEKIVKDDFPYFTENVMLGENDEFIINENKPISSFSLYEREFALNIVIIAVLDNILKYPDDLMTLESIKYDRDRSLKRDIKYGYFSNQLHFEAGNIIITYLKALIVFEEQLQTKKSYVSKRLKVA